MVEQIKIQWATEAINNLNEIHNYISRDSVFYADKTVDNIYVSVSKLSKYPEIGTPLTIKTPFLLRRILIKSFRVVYLYHNNTIFIVMVERQKKLLPDNFDFIEKYI